jgi:hypothetical protein
MRVIISKFAVTSLLTSLNPHNTRLLSVQRVRMSSGATAQVRGVLKSLSQDLIMFAGSAMEIQGTSVCLDNRLASVRF